MLVMTRRAAALRGFTWIRKARSAPADSELPGRRNDDAGTEAPPTERGFFWFCDNPEFGHRARV